MQDMHDLLALLGAIAIAGVAPRLRTKTAARVRPLAFRVVDEAKMPVRSASGVAVHGKDDLLVIDDDTGVYRVRDGVAKLVWGRQDGKPLGDLEAVTLDRQRGVAYVVSEEKGVVYRFAVDPPRDGKAKLEKLGALPDIGRVLNAGWEGLAFLPAALSWDGEDHLVAGHEGQPRRLVVLSVPELRVQREFRLDGDAKDLLADIADVAVHPTTGHLHVLSCTNKQVVEMKLDKQGLTTIAAGALPLKKAESPEGIDFAGDDRMVVVCDGGDRLLTLSAAPASSRAR